MNSTVKLEKIAHQSINSSIVDLPSIQPEMAKVLEITQKNNSSVTPREINEHLACILKDYDELTALFAKNNRRIDEELVGVKQIGSAVSQRLQHIDAELQLQHGSLTTLTSSTGALQTTQNKIQTELIEAEGRLNSKLDSASSEIERDVARLEAKLGSLGEVLEAQENIILEQSARLDQFDVAYELLDTATRGNRKRIETVREETEKQHAIASAQIQGLEAIQREHYAEFSEVRRLVALLQKEAARLDHDIQTVASDLKTHAVATHRTFKRTHISLAAVALLTLSGFAAFKWAPAFVPASAEQAFAQSNQRIAAIDERLTVLPALQSTSVAQGEKIDGISTKVAALNRSVGELKKSIRELQLERAGATTAAAAAATAPVLDRDWLLQQNPKYFTIQLLGVGSYDEMQGFIQRNREPLQDVSIAYTLTQPDHRDRYNLFYGVFDRVDSAQAAIDAMPSSLRANKPWVRQIQSVQESVK